MVDTFTKKKRSAIMRNIRANGTRPEITVKRIARRVRRSFSSNAAKLPGKPDIAYFRLKRAIFVHGCFWHQHRDCARANIPKSNRQYWLPKLEGNVARDLRNVKALRARGWKVLILWECKCKSTPEIEKRIRAFLA